MFSRFKDFLSRHKRKFIITGVVVGGTALAIGYAQRKLREFQVAQAREFIEKAKKTQHFESTERLCNQAIIGFAPNIYDIIINALDTDAILKQIRQNPANKHELWNELKILSFTRLTTLVYAYSMMVIVYRIQINLIGGYLFNDTVNIKCDEDRKLTNKIQEQYLLFGQHNISDGILQLIKLIESKVRDVLNNYNLQDKITLSNVEQIFWSIQMAINSDKYDPNSHLSKYVYPKCDDETIIYNKNNTLLKLYNETLDILESYEISNLCTNNVSRGFTIVIDNIADFYSENAFLTTPIAARQQQQQQQQIIDIDQPSTSGLNQILNINQIELPLPKLIPIIVGLSGKPFNYNGRPPSLSTSLVTLYLLSDKIKLLGANIYELFSQ